MSDLSTAEKRLACISEQFELMESGKAVLIGCPYCGGTNLKGEPMCCGLFAKGLKVVLDARDLAKRLELADRIANRVN